MPNWDQIWKTNEVGLYLEVSVMLGHFYPCDISLFRAAFNN